MTETSQKSADAAIQSTQNSVEMREVDDQLTASLSPQIPAGMVEWHGQTKEPPEDWDGGAYLCRDGKMYFLNGWDWGHGTHCWNPTASWDRIAYTPIRTPPHDQR